MLVDQALQLLAGDPGAQHGFVTQADQQHLVGSATATGLGHPAQQFLSSGLQYPVDLPAPPPAAFLLLHSQPAMLRHASQFTVDLMMTRVPEVPHGMIEAVSQPVAGGGSFLQGGKQGVLNGHGSLWCAGCSVCPDLIKPVAKTK